MDATALLIADHNRVRGLFAQFRAAHEEEDQPAMATSALRILDELEVHTAVEEEIFYPAARDGSGELQEGVAEGLEEHHVVDVLAAEIKALQPGSEAWIAKMTVLIENVEHHAEEEETEMFPQARKTLGTDALEGLAERIEVRKSQLGAAVSADKEHLTVEELKSLAQDQQIPGRSQMDRAELLATVAPPG